MYSLTQYALLHFGKLSTALDDRIILFPIAADDLSSVSMEALLVTLRQIFYLINISKY
jgi:hypothetical protein